jgi:predicted tellurium resistance membrane protein TerC
MIFMFGFVNHNREFIDRHPALKVLALSFLMLIGCALVAEGFHKEIPKGYIYFAMAFSVRVECLNIRLRARAQSTRVKLHQPYR